MKLYIIRHGESEANLHRYYAGQSDAKLTPLGIEQAKAIAPLLADIPFDRVYSSDLSRALDTQSYALPGWTAERTPLLREYDVGSVTGKSIEETIRYYAEKGIAFPQFNELGGENAEMVRTRLRKFLAKLEADPCENVAAFAHGGLMLTMAQIVLGNQVNPAALRSDNCCIHVFEWDGQRWSLLAWNYMRKV